MDLHGILVVDKPRGITSHDVVARVRRLLQTRKVGHAGTLDPAAEGLLILGIGRATKLLGALSGHPKRYAAEVILGVGSESGDIEGPALLRDAPIVQPSVADVRSALINFTGEIEQVPPLHAAIKVGGQPLYRRARRGMDIEVPSRQVTIDSIELIEYRYPRLALDIRCSAGTYVRSLARDLGELLGTRAYLHQLVRSESGHFDLGEAWELEALERRLRPATFARFALHPALVERSIAALVLGPTSVNAWYDGRPMAASARSGLDRAHAFQADGSWLGVGLRERDVWHPKIVVHG